LNDKEKKKKLIERLNILTFYNTKEINDCLKSLENDLNQSNEAVKDARKLKEVLKEIFPISQQKNIESLNDYENELKNKLLKDAKIKFNKLNNINDLVLNQMDKLSSSKIFLTILNKKKGENLNNDGINLFKCAEKEYIKLRELLDTNWEDSIIEIIEEFPFKNLNENEIEEELFILKKYFEMNNINESEIINRKNRLIFIIQKKGEIISNLNNSFNFISEFATQNIRNSLNNLKDVITKNINIAMINKYNNNNLLEKYFLNQSNNNYPKSKKNNKNYSFEKFENNQKNELIQKLNAEKEKNKILIDQIQALKISQNNFNQQISYAINDSRRFSILKPGEKVISIIVQTTDQNINKSFACKNTDIFVDLEKEIYNEYNEYKDIETVLICN
jgi:hypothetical protein